MSTTRRRRYKSDPIPTSKPEARGLASPQRAPNAISRRSSPPAAARSGKAYVALADDLQLEAGEVSPFKAEFFQTIAQVNVRTAHERLNVVGRRQSIAAVRGYDRDDLFAVAEIGYHYLFMGGAQMALTLFEGLTAVAPDEAYFALALGLTHDRLNNVSAANQWYRRASELDPTEARADINRAELFLQRGDRRAARELLVGGERKARRKGESDLTRKATAMLGHIDRAV